MAYQSLLPRPARQQAESDLARHETGRGSPDHIRRCRFHAIRRAAERYGLLFEVNDVIEHEEMIRLGLARQIGGAGNDALFEIQGEFRSYFAIYHRDIGCIATYLRGAHEWTGTMRRAR